MQRVKEILEKVLAVEKLEYLDKNLLSGDNATRSEWKQQVLQCAITTLEDISNEKKEVYYSARGVVGKEITHSYSGE